MEHLSWTVFTPQPSQSEIFARGQNPHSQSYATRFTARPSATPVSRSSFVHRADYSQASRSSRIWLSISSRDNRDAAALRLSFKKTSSAALFPASAQGVADAASLAFSERSFTSAAIHIPLFIFQDLAPHFPWEMKDSKPAGRRSLLPMARVLPRRVKIYKA